MMLGRESGLFKNSFYWPTDSAHTDTMFSGLVVQTLQMDEVYLTKGTQVRPSHVRPNYTAR